MIINPSLLSGLKPMTRFSGIWDQIQFIFVIIISIIVYHNYLWQFPLHSMDTCMLHCCPCVASLQQHQQRNSLVSEKTMQAGIPCFVYIAAAIATALLVLSMVWVDRNPRMNAENYRLGDVTNGFFFEKNHGGCAKIRAVYSKHYPKSIAAKYLQSTCKGKIWATLCSIANTHSTIAPKASAVVHVRLGDVAERADIKYAWSTTEKCTSVYPDTGHTPDCWYIRSALFYKETVIPALAAKNATSILFIGSSRHCVLWARQSCQSKNSDWYRERITQLFVRAGFGVAWSWNQPADIDFVMMATARVFVVGGGGFSTGAAHCVHRNNGTVIGAITSA